MDYKTLGVICVILGGLILYIDQQGIWIISAILCGLGGGIFFWKENKNDTEK